MQLFEQVLKIYILWNTTNDFWKLENSYKRLISERNKLKIHVFVDLLFWTDLSCAQS